MKPCLLAAAVWLAASIPAAILTGKVLRRRRRELKSPTRVPTTARVDGDARTRSGALGSARMCPLPEPSPDLGGSGYPTFEIVSWPDPAWRWPA